MKTKSIIFYAEDDLDDQEIFKNALHDINYEADLYFQNHGDELLHDLKYHSVVPNLIFLDLNMPGKTGYHVLQEIREMEEFCNIPIIILSTASDPVASHRAKNLGANLFITKPTVYSQFISLMKIVMSMDWADVCEAKQPFYINISQSTIVKAS